LARLRGDLGLGCDAKYRGDPKARIHGPPRSCRRRALGRPSEYRRSSPAHSLPILCSKCSDHLACAQRMLVDEHDNASVGWLRSQTLRHEPDRAIAVEDQEPDGQLERVESGSRTLCFTSSAATCSTSWNIRTPTGTPASASSSSGARTTYTWCRRGRARALPEDDHPEPERHQGVPR
jgi:hypothetical protein